jgi:hypothetical protein
MQERLSYCKLQLIYQSIVLFYHVQRLEPAQASPPQDANSKIHKEVQNSYTSTDRKPSSSAYKSLRKVHGDRPR